jgi:hypothetical protein
MYCIYFFEGTTETPSTCQALSGVVFYFLSLLLYYDSIMEILLCYFFSIFIMT